MSLRTTLRNAFLANAMDGNGQTLDDINLTNVTVDGQPLRTDSLVFSSQNKDTTTLLPGQPVTMHSSGVGVVRASAWCGLQAVGIVTTATAPGFAVALRAIGMLTLDDWVAVTGFPLLTPRSIYYLSLTAGQLTDIPTVASGTLLQVIGNAVSLNQLQINIGRAIRL